MVVDLEADETQFRREKRSTILSAVRRPKSSGPLRMGRVRNAGDMVVRRVLIRPGQQGGCP
jgi:hypothetical protein